MSLIGRDRAKALGAMRHAITMRPATWTPDDVLDAVVDSGAVVWASNHRGAVVLDDTAIERAALALAREPGWDGAEHDANEAARRILHALGGQYA